MSWFTTKKECVHCQKNRTKRDFEGQPTCSECQMNILMSRESKRLCPIDASPLMKYQSNEIIIDRCPKCNGIWLDAGELEIIKEAAKKEGMGSGVALGMVIG